MAKDKKAKAAEKKARTAAKADKKTAQKAKKASKKGPKNAADADSDAESVDLDAVLAQYAAAQEQFLKVTETVCAPPSARSSATLLANPANERELLLFGGEFFNGALARFYNDLYIYNTRRDEWRLVTSPNSPLPRSGHAWTRGGNAGNVWLFGGEFSSPKQGTFYHYGDFWMLEPASREWSRVESKGRNSAPSARSGHRMTFFKQYIILFGGFQDTSSTTKYLADLWLYDTQTFAWIQPTLPPASPRPDPRSSFSFLPHDHGAVLAGGYSRVKSSTPTTRKNAPPTSTLKPQVHTDTWFLRITPPAPTSPHNTPPSVRRHNGRGILFGGVHDVEASEEGIESTFFNGLFAWNVERNRFFPLAIRRARAPVAKKSEGGGKRNRGKADEAELLARLRLLEGASGAGEGEPDAEVGSESESDSDSANTKPISQSLPAARFNAALAVAGDELFIYGGTFEAGDREVTFDEMHALHLGRLDGVREIFRREVGEWIGEGSEEGSDEEDDDDDDEDDEEEGEPNDQDGTEPPTPAPTSTSTIPTDPTPADADADEDDAASDPNADPDTTDPPEDTSPHPRPFESLRAFYSRTSTAWQDQLLHDMSLAGPVVAETKTVKEIRAGAFARAESRWWSVREEVRALEDEREASGVGEVVSLEERGGDKGGKGARRR